MARILFAEWSPERVELAALQLAEEGHQTQILADGRAALAQVSADAPDVLVTEVMLPFIDGFQLVDQLRQLRPDHRVPVIMLTAPPAEVGASFPAPPPPIVRWIIHQPSAEEMTGQITQGVREALSEGHRHRG